MRQRCGKIHLLTDDYTLAILPLATLLAEKPGIEQCSARTGKDLSLYHGVLRTGTIGYQLYIYLGLVRGRFGEQVWQKVRERQLGILSPVDEFGLMLDMIEAAVDIGAVITSTAQGEVVTPVEMTVALTLLLGLPESVHYVTRPEQRAEQIARMPPEIDWYFADLLAHGRREIVGVFDTLVSEPVREPDADLQVGELRYSKGGTGV